MSKAPPLLLQVLRAPARLRQLDAEGWERLVREARHADLLARIASLAEGLVDLPAGVGGHLCDIRVLAAAQQAEVRREVEHLAAALRPLGVPVTLLKGAAYVLSGAAAARGRLFGDVDILVPRASLAAVEAALMQHGWITTHLDAYDQRYYREWMHELPPMQHIHRQTVVDVHRGILPETARNPPDAARLLQAAQAVPGHRGVQVLAPADMLLHSATHLFHNDEFSHGLRDLSDIDLLLRQFGAADPGFWDGLHARATELNLVRPLYHALHHARELLGTPVPDATWARVQGAGAPSAPWAGLAASLWRRVLAPMHPDCAAPFTPLALGLLYLRGHALRMPPGLLVRHLATKALMRSRAPRDPAANDLQAPRV